MSNTAGLPPTGPGDGHHAKLAARLRSAPPYGQLNGEISMH